MHLTVEYVVYTHHTKCKLLSTTRVHHSKCESCKTSYRWKTTSSNAQCFSSGATSAYKVWHLWIYFGMQMSIQYAPRKLFSNHCCCHYRLRKRHHLMLMLIILQLQLLAPLRITCLIVFVIIIIIICCCCCYCCCCCCCIMILLISSKSSTYTKAVPLNRRLCW